MEVIIKKWYELPMGIEGCSKQHPSLISRQQPEALLPLVLPETRQGRQAVRGSRFFFGVGFCQGGIWNQPLYSYQIHGSE